MRGQKHWEESQEGIDNWINAFSLRRFLVLKTTDGSWESVTFSIIMVEKNLIPVSVVVHFDERWTSKKLGQSFRCRSLSFSPSLSSSLFLYPFFFKEVCVSSCQLRKRQFTGRQNGGHDRSTLEERSSECS